MRTICIGLFLVVIAATPVLAQTKHLPNAVPAVPAASEPTVTAAKGAARTAAREQALADLDDADSIARLGALEDILGSKDGILIELALRKVMAGTDQEMKALALRKAVSDPTREFVFEIHGCGYTGSSDQNVINNNCNNATSELSDNINLIFDRIDMATGQFRLHATKTVKRNSLFSSYPGKIIGTDMNFALDLYATGNSDMQDCNGHLSLNKSGQMAGTIRCRYLIFEGSFSVL